MRGLGYLMEISSLLAWQELCFGRLLWILDDISCPMFPASYIIQSSGVVPLDVVVVMRATSCCYENVLFGLGQLIILQIGYKSW